MGIFELTIQILVGVGTLLSALSFVLYLSSKSHYGIVKWTFLFYSIAHFYLLFHKGFVGCDPVIDTYLVILQTAAVFFYGAIILNHFKVEQRIHRKMTEKLSNAFAITWEDVQKGRKYDKINFTVAMSKMLHKANDKVVYESTVKPGKTGRYFNDFVKEYHVLDGELNVIFDKGSNEQLTKNAKTRIAPYEVHKLETKGCKLLVTCIKT